MTLLKVTELGSAKISDSAIVNVLRKQINKNIEIKYDLSEDIALKSLSNKTVDLAIIPNNTSIDDPELEVRTIVPLLPRILVLMGHKIPEYQEGDLKGLLENNTLIYEDMSRIDSIFFKDLFTNFNIDAQKISGYTAKNIDINNWSDSCFVYVGLTHLHNPLMIKLIDLGADFISIDKVSNLGKGSSAEGFKLTFPSSYPFILPKSFYKGIPDRPILTIAIRDILVGLSDLDKTVVYDIAKTIIENKAQLIQFDNIYNMLETQFSENNYSFPLHQGTEQYLTRNRPSLWTRYAAIIWPFVSMVAIFASAFASFQNRMRVRRKLRIESFYKVLLRIRKRAIEDKENNNTEELLAEMENLRSKAFDALMDNKLLARESFKIFLELYSEIKVEIMETDQ